MTASRRRTLTQIKSTEKSPRFHPGRCEDCGDWSRIRGWRLGDWLCGYCFHGEERVEVEDGEVDHDFGLPNDGTISRDIVDILDEHGKLRTTDIVEQLGRSTKNYVWKKLTKMNEEGLVEKEIKGHAWWSLSDGISLREVK